MKKYKIALGICGCNVIYTNIIKANSPEEAVEKYLDSRDPAEAKQLYKKPEDRLTREQEIECLLKTTVEYVSKPRKKA